MQWQHRTISHRTPAGLIRERFPNALLTLTAFALLLGVAFEEGMAQQSRVAPTVSNDRSLDALRDQVFAQWRKRRQEVQAIHCVVEGTVLVPKGTHDEDVAYARRLPNGNRDATGSAPASDYTHDYRLDCLVDIKGNRYRLEVESELFHLNTESFRPTHDVWAYNVGDLRLQRPGVTVNRPEHYSPLQAEFKYHKLDYPVLTLKVQPVLFACGIVPPSSRVAKVPPLDDISIEERLQVHGRALHEGRECLVLRTPRGPAKDPAYYEYWADPSRDGLVVRAVLYEPAISESVNVKYEETSDGWYPNGWTHTQFDLGTHQPVSVLDAKVTELDRQPQFDSESFVISPSEGMVVADQLAGEAYVLGPNGERLPVRSVLEEDNKWLTWLLAILFLVLIFFLSVLFWRRWRRLAASR